MLTTLRKELEKKGIDRRACVYEKTPESVMDYPLSIGDFVESTSAEKAVEDFGVLQEYYGTQMELYAQCGEYNQAAQRLRCVKKQLKERKVSADELEAIRKASFIYFKPESTGRSDWSW